MRFIGFLKKFDANIPNAKAVEDYINNEPWGYSVSLPDIISFLDHGKALASSMTLLMDEEGEPIGGTVYYSDGIYIWPSYFSFYLRKYGTLNISNDFIDHVANNFTKAKIDIDDVELKKMIEFFTVFWSNKAKKSKKSLKVNSGPKVVIPKRRKE